MKKCYICRRTFDEVEEWFSKNFKKKSIPADITGWELETIKFDGFEKYPIPMCTVCIWLIEHTLLQGFDNKVQNKLEELFHGKKATIEGEIFLE